MIPYVVGLDIILAYLLSKIIVILLFFCSKIFYLNDKLTKPNEPNLPLAQGISPRYPRALPQVATIRCITLSISIEKSRYRAILWDIGDSWAWEKSYLINTFSKERHKNSSSTMQLHCIYQWIARMMHRTRASYRPNTNEKYSRLITICLRTCSSAFLHGINRYYFRWLTSVSQKR